VGIRTGVYNQTAMLSEVISGSLLTLFLFDVSDEIRLDELRQVLNAPASPRQGGVRQPAPAYVGSHERGPIPSGASLAELTDITRGKELLPPRQTGDWRKLVTYPPGAELAKRVR